MTANPTLLSMPLAQNGQKNAIPTTQATAGDGLFSQSTGFPAETSLPLGAGGKAPSREDFNGMANLLGGVAYYAQKGWIFQFDAGQDYFAGCIVRDTTDGKMYECLNDVAAGGSVPSADTVNWKEYGVDPSIVANTDLSNLTLTGEARFAHAVIESYYDDTNGDWYRVYADGWVEQGGLFPVPSSQGYHSETITFLKAFADTRYTVATVQAYANNPYANFVNARTTTTMTINNITNGSNVIQNSAFGSWIACGMGASV